MILPLKKQTGILAFYEQQLSGRVRKPFGGGYTARSGGRSTAPGESAPRLAATAERCTSRYEADSGVNTSKDVRNAPLKYRRYCGKNSRTRYPLPSEVPGCEHADCKIPQFSPRFPCCPDDQVKALASMVTY
jgi:hypothetical protein